MEALTRQTRSMQAHDTFCNLFGEEKGRFCGGCRHFVLVNKYYPKCRLSCLMDHTRESNWNAGWKACGKYEQQKR